MQHTCQKCGQNHSASSTSSFGCIPNLENERGGLPGFSPSWKEGLRAGALAGVTVGLPVAGVTAVLFQGATIHTLILTGVGSLAIAGIKLGLSIPLALACAAFLKALLAAMVVGIICGALGLLANGKLCSQAGAAMAVAVSLASSGFSLGLYTIFVAPLTGGIVGRLCSLYGRRRC